MLHRFARIWTARRGAEVGAATERAVLVDRAMMVCECLRRCFLYRQDSLRGL